MGTWSRSDLKQRAKQVLQRTYGKVLLITIILMVVESVGSGINYKINSTGNTLQMFFERNDEKPSAANPAYESGSRLSQEQWDGIIEAFKEYLEEIMPIILSVLALVLVIGLIAFLFKTMLKALVLNPIRISAMRFLLTNRVRDDAELSLLDYAFKHNYKNVIITMFFKDLYIFLWTLLFWIPGIVKSYEYRMIPYLLAENPLLSKEDAFRISKEMMDGEKWNAFVLDLSFFGWYLLSVFTCGILAVLYVSPYQLLTNTELYVALSLKTGGVYKNYRQDQYDSYGQNYQQNQYDSYGQNYQQNQYGSYDQNYQQNQYGSYDQNYQQNQYGSYDQYYNQWQNGNGNSGQ